MQFKMARRKTISMELYNAIKSEDYCDFVGYLGPKDGLGIAAFLDSTCGQFYTADTTLLHCNGRRTNNNHIYQMFGEFSGMDSEEVKMAMLKEITNNCDFYERKCMAILHNLDMNLSHWLGHHLKKNVRADVLAIFVLSVMYDRHTVIHTNSMPWCTKKFFSREGEGNLFNCCHIHLLGVGDNMFIILRPKATPSPLQSKSDIPGGSMEIFTSNTETHVEYTFELPKPSEKDTETDCEVMDYYLPMPQNTIATEDNQTTETALIADDPCYAEAATLSIDSGPCERLSNGFSKFCEMYLNPSNMDQVNKTLNPDTENIVTSNNEPVPVNLLSDSDRTVSLNLSVRISDWDLSSSERSFVTTNVKSNIDMSDSHSELMNINGTSSNDMDTDNEHVTVMNPSSDTSSDNSSDDSENMFPSETSISHIETDCSMNENIIRISNEIVIELTNRTGHLVLPKLTDKTINYWKSTDRRENTPRLTPPTTNSAELNCTNVTGLDESALDPTKENLKDNMIKPEHDDQDNPLNASSLCLKHTASSGYNTSGTDASSGHNTPKTQDDVSSTVKASSGQNTPITLDDVSLPAKASSGHDNTRNQTEDSDDSLSESLLKPMRTRPNRKASMKKYINFKHMCNSNTSSDAEPPVKPLKPLPGLSPSNNCIRAQELINKHRIPKSQCDNDGYSGDTEDYTDSDYSHDAVIKGTLHSIIGHTPELSHMLVKSATRILRSTNNGNATHVHKVMSTKNCFVN